MWTHYISYSTWRQHSQVWQCGGLPATPAARCGPSREPRCRQPRPPTRPPPASCPLRTPPRSRHKSDACSRPCSSAGTGGSAGCGRCRSRCSRRGRTWSLPRCHSRSPAGGACRRRLRTYTRFGKAPSSCCAFCHCMKMWHCRRERETAVCTLRTGPWAPSAGEARSTWGRAPCTVSWHNTSSFPSANLKQSLAGCIFKTGNLRRLRLNTWEVMSVLHRTVAQIHCGLQWMEGNMRQDLSL